MTCIVDYKTKKAFREAVVENPDRVRVVDPSIMYPYSGSALAYMEEVGYMTVTNHPKRSWFASVEWKDGRLLVK